jgi:hypothetical protein
MGVAAVVVAVAAASVIASLVAVGWDPRVGD